MKTIVLFLLILILGSFTLQAQKMAYVDSDAIISKMQAYKRAKAEVETYSKILQKQLERKQAEMQNYYTKILEDAQAGRLSPAQQKEEEEKLSKMQEELQQAAAKADQNLVKKEQELVKPIYEKFNQALSEVARENGYNYIIDKKMMLYTAGGIDATAKIKAKLGILN